MQHGELPGQLHFEEPSAHVPWEKLPLKITAENSPWPQSEERIAGVTALGLSGTNAHVILSSKVGEDCGAEAQSDRAQHLLMLSARGESSLRRLADNYRRALSGADGLRLADVCHTAALGRRHFEQRAALVVESVEQACTQLGLLASGGGGLGTSHGTCREHAETGLAVR